MWLCLLDIYKQINENIYCKHVFLIEESHSAVNEGQVIRDVNRRLVIVEHFSQTQRIFRVADHCIKQKQMNG